MSYKIVFERISVKNDGTEYTYHWPEDLEKEETEGLERLLYEHNRLLQFLEQKKLELDVVEGNMFFLMLKKGAVLFTLSSENSKMSPGAGLQGIFIPLSYVTTAWLLIDKLKIFLYCMDDEEYQGIQEIDENQLDQLLEEMDMSAGTDINPDGTVAPYNFSIGCKDPGIEGVLFYSTIADAYGEGTNAWSVDRALQYEADSSEVLAYAPYFVERSVSSNKMVFFRKRKGTIWQLHDKETDQTEPLELLEKNKIIHFSKLVKTVEKGGIKDGKTVG